MKTKLKILFFYRKRGINYSIERVFDTIYLNFKNKENIDINIKSVKYHRAKIADLIKNIIFVYRNKITDINHIVGDIHYVSLVLPRKNTVLTIHDMVGYYQNKGIKRFISFLFWYYLPCKKMKYITCISEATKTDLINIAKCNPKKINIIPNPLNSDYHYSFKEFNVFCPTILHIGTRNNKNLERVIEALTDIPCHLRIIGELNNNQFELLKKNHIKFSNSSNLSNSEIVEEYMKCDIVSFPSLFEGFGMPIIEGQATGRIVLTSNIEPMNSIASDGAVLVNPFDIKSIKSGFEHIICNSNYRNQLIQSGLNNAKKFSVENIASEYLNLYDKIVNNRNDN